MNLPWREKNDVETELFESTIVTGQQYKTTFCMYDEHIALKIMTSD